MKKIIKSNMLILTGILIGITFSGITVYAAYRALASNISYTPSDSTWNVENVEEALNELHNKQEIANPIPVGSGEVSYSSGITSDTLVPATLENDTYLSLENNVFTVKKAGTYIIYGSVGSNLMSVANAVYSGSANIYINDVKKMSLNQTWDYYETGYIIEKLNVGDTISIFYKGNGGGYTKRSKYYILYLG